jgi:hypothetical protein
MVGDQLPPRTSEIVTRLIDANECGVALETVSEMLVESEASIPHGNGLWRTEDATGGR